MHHDSPNRLLLSGVLLLLVACQAQGPGVARPEPGERVPAAPQEAPADAVDYAIDGTASAVRILVYRGGPLAKFGHSHVVEADSLQGTIRLAPGLNGSTFELRVDPARFVLDRPAARAEEGAEFSGQLSEEAIAATRKNMLGPEVLDVSHYPVLTLQGLALAGPPWAQDVSVRITLHGVTREFTLAAAVAVSGDTLTVTGTFPLRTSDFGIEPFTAMGGGLRVEDGIRIRFHLVAHRAG